MLKESGLNEGDYRVLEEPQNNVEKMG